MVGLVRATEDSSDSIREALRGARLFGDLGDRDLLEIAACCRFRTIAKGQYLFRRDQTAFGFFLVHSGAINLHRIDSKGRDVVLCVFRPGDTFAEGTLSAHIAYPADAKALERSKVVVIERAAFLRFVQTHPWMSMRILESMGLRMRFLVGQLEARRFPEAAGRLADWLLKAANPAPRGSGFTVILDRPKKVLAAELGLTPETLSRSFSRLSAKGLIRLRGASIFIPEKSPLRQACAARPGE